VKKEIYLIRHGETEYNRFGKVQGSSIDSELNDTGRAQAALFFENYMDINFNKIYISNLQRTFQSVQAFEKQGAVIEKHTGLNEICWGYHEGKATSGLDKTYYSWLMEQWRTGETSVQVRGGESPQDVADRQKPVIDLIFSRPEEERIMICMHGRAMRIFLCQLLNLPLKDMDIFAHQNLGLYILEVDEQNKVKVAKTNCTRHLDSLEQLCA
jgi:broad specificity phosphatase PhoE